MNEYERHLGGTAGNGDPESRGKPPAEIEREIEATRERMSQNIDELGERLSPANLKRQAKDAITGKAQNIAHNVGEQARERGFRVVDFIQENPSLVALTLSRTLDARSASRPVMPSRRRSGPV